MTTSRSKPRSPWERFKVEELPVWWISEQSYCEQRFHLWMQAPSARPSVPRHMDGYEAVRLSQAADEGSDFHRRVAALPTGAPENPASSIELRRFVRASDELQLLEWMFRAEFDSYPIAGAPDVVCFEKGLIRGILDYKVTDSNQLQMNHRSQLLLYGWLLQQEKFRMNDGLCVSVLVPSASAKTFDGITFDHEHVSRKIYERARAVVDSDPHRHNWYDERFNVGKKFWVRLRIFRFKRKNAVSELDFFTRYWSGVRKPQPSENPNKCRVCLYNSAAMCKVAAAPYGASASTVARMRKSG